MVGCAIKTPSAKVNNGKKELNKEKIQKVNNVQKVKEVKRKNLPEGFKEIKKLRPIKENVPATCQEWSDGCNTCTHAKNNQASCTIYTCETKGPFSCLKWQ
jgi:negative regulator of sigma E activity